MASDVVCADRAALEKFAKFLTLKVAQIVVQSRQGQKIGQFHNNETNTSLPESRLSPPPQTQLGVDSFNLAIPELAEVTIDTKRLLNGETVAALTNIIIIEISLTTTDGDEMVLELWTIKMDRECDPAMTSLSTIYYRMGIMLKSTLTISRIAPAYKLSRCQSNESYIISYRIYSGQPNTDLLGEGYRRISVSEVATLCGTIQISLLYRTMMNLSTSKKQQVADPIMVKSDHFPFDSPRNEKKVIDLNKPLTAGAFVDTQKIKKLHATLSQQLPPEPPMSWLLAEKERMENKMKQRSISEGMDASQLGSSSEPTSSSVPTALHSKAIEVPSKNRYHSESQKYSKMMEFPFADGSPIRDLANFYQECLQARSHSDEWCDIPEPLSGSSDSEAMSRQLKQFEDAVPEFDSMVASMFSNSENGDS